MTEQWLSIVEYARTFKVSDMTIRRRIKTGKLHAILQDGKYFIPVSGNAVNQRPNLPPRHPQDRVVVSESGRDALSDQKLPFNRVGSVSMSEPVVIKSNQIGIKQATQQISSEFESHQRQGEMIVPGSLTRPLLSQESSLVDTRALLAYCEASLRKISDNERRTVEKFKSKLETLEAVLASRDLEIKALRQQLEDLQLLVKILERRKQA
ncbi:MAG: hypothetical protein FJ146_03095 [Deltaproteobacteria bacterium]|nr:hypothetical protein [Deltaproteobacteria bacterium]